MPRRKIAKVTIPLILFLLLLPLSARAQNQDLEQAQAAGSRAVELFQAGRYAEAIPLARSALKTWEAKFGPEDPMVAAGLALLARLLDAAGKPAEARPLYERALAITKKAFGPEAAETARALNNLAALYYRQGDYARAEPLYQRALAIREKALGPDHPDVAVSLNNLAALYEARAEYRKAEPLYIRSLAIREKAFGPDDPRVAVGLNNLAALHEAKGEYKKAEPLYRRALAIREKALGPDHPDVAESLNNLALLYDTLGEFKQAESLYKKALSSREKTLGPDHPDTAVSLNNLAEFCKSLGDYGRALPLHQRALAIREKAFGPFHPDVAQSLNNLALVHETQGDPAQAEALLKKALAVWEKALGPDHPETAAGLNNLAEFYKSLGDYQQAEPLYQRSLAIREKTLGPDHPDVALALNNLAGLADARRQYQAAEERYLRSLRIWQKALGPDNPNVATALTNLSNVYFNQGRYTQARSMDEQALTIREKRLGPDHPDTAASLNNLAGFYFASGDLDQAETLYGRAAAIVEKTLGPSHPDTVKAFSNLAAIKAARGQYQAAFELLKRTQEMDSQLIDQVMGFTSEDQKLKFLALKKYGLYAFFSLVLRHLADDPAARREALDLWLKRKGLVLEAQRRFQEAWLYFDAPEVRQTFQDLAGVRAALSRLVFSGPGREGLEAYKKKMAELEARARELEARLARLSREFALKKKADRADGAKVAAALPASSAMLEFARVDVHDFQAKDKTKRWLPAHYLVFVLPAGREARVSLIDLGPAEIIDLAVAEFKKKVMDLDDLSDRSADQAAARLHDLVFAPLKEAIGPAREIFISPDGNLNLIPFEVLLSPDGRRLIEDYSFNYLSAGRDILTFDQGRDVPRSPMVVLMGDPDFDLKPEERASALAGLKLSISEQKPETGFIAAPLSRDIRGMVFTPLEGTREEVQAIAAILGPEKARVYLGAEVMEEVLKGHQGPAVLHLATHGFFLGNLEIKPAGDRSVLSADESSAGEASGRGLRIENPLLRSGLALAGANQALAAGGADGILTAEKVLGLNLRGTGMVVLSACQTGLGEVKSGEGVYGLRRAFTQAGARALVLSMWSVPDQETKELMVEFYKRLADRKTGRAQALRQAMLHERQTVKQRYGHDHPLFWGAFVYLGE
ncbi:MAG: CHAT domain-containing tetratricopeptide repeat protein [Thermodesulfobacteriota bacterium]